MFGASKIQKKLLTSTMDMALKKVKNSLCQNNF